MPICNAGHRFVTGKECPLCDPRAAQAARPTHAAGLTIVNHPRVSPSFVATPVWRRWLLRLVIVTVLAATLLPAVVRTGGMLLARFAGFIFLYLLYRALRRPRERTTSRRRLPWWTLASLVRRPQPSGTGSDRLVTTFIGERAGRRRTYVLESRHDPMLQIHDHIEAWGVPRPGHLAVVRLVGANGVVWRAGLGGVMTGLGIIIVAAAVAVDFLGRAL